MPDASPMDPAKILKELERIEKIIPVEERVYLEDVDWLCQQLRTALADTRRVDQIEELATETTLEMSRWALEGVQIKIEPGHRILIAEAPDLRTALDLIKQNHAAMAATPREDGHG